MKRRCTLRRSQRSLKRKSRRLQRLLLSLLLLLLRKTRKLSASLWILKKRFAEPAYDQEIEPVEPVEPVELTEFAELTHHSFPGDGRSCFGRGCAC